MCRWDRRPLGTDGEGRRRGSGRDRLGAKRVGRTVLSRAEGMRWGSKSNIESGNGKWRGFGSTDAVRSLGNVLGGGGWEAGV